VTDIRDEVKATLSSQHIEIKGLMDAVRDSHGLQRVAAFEKFKTFLAAHEAAEEQWVHAAGKADLDDTDVVDRRMAEENEAGEAITELERLGTHHDDFPYKFETLTGDVIDHAEAEEHRELPRLLEVADDAEVERMLAALKHVPRLVWHITGPHPFMELLTSARENLKA
jgi:hemerythrin superfamily protein